MTLRGMTIAAVLVAGVGLSGCQTAGNNQAAGTTIGAVGGATAGAIIARRTGNSPVVGALIGGVAGGLIGGAIGAALDEEERRQLQAATIRAAASARVGQRIAWTAERGSGRAAAKRRPGRTSTASASAEAATPAKKASGYVVPTSDTYTSSGRTCRDLQQVAVKDGQTLQQNITACKSGSNWEVPQA